jgi:hypothetical protein
MLPSLSRWRPGGGEEPACEWMRILWPEQLGCLSRTLWLGDSILRVCPIAEGRSGSPVGHRGMPNAVKLIRPSGVQTSDGLDAHREDSPPLAGDPWPRCLRKRRRKKRDGGYPSLWFPTPNSQYVESYMPPSAKPERLNTWVEESTSIAGTIASRPSTTRIRTTIFFILIPPWMNKNVRCHHLSQGLFSNFCFLL